jgi:hypothetical protein
MEIVTFLKCNITRQTIINGKKLLLLVSNALYTFKIAAKINCNIAI